MRGEIVAAAQLVDIAHVLLHRWRSSKIFKPEPQLFKLPFATLTKRLSSLRSSRKHFLLSSFLLGLQLVHGASAQAVHTHAPLRGPH